ncbi:MAG: 2-oxoacid:acceptor oxidoreductase family protein [Verrucomicrobia bacterium]|jgi:indolepyruvate ferredoxin oxidoreductase beta subunit|nr:2-oxoacid:acceptor oxidoreductase family protein [Verrucomicrobiota bacterium]OQC67038.1 MAG: indolepyruvate oxidoreductase subunit beta [Verrucomicrobia bacterium ADurb.Bin006]MDI9382308.1 2-oxoacid:acceptor oxidoreductase family protein [Verrucomicrobiota bacterium]NMD21579.1 pyruvate ferredoxin oxidoreductase [Verrucomicrobiota bacterium]HNV00542.1 2-oxoacid:acceptor oxidoreductase family protein [Verrucomicrobiota bacterium]
MTATVTNIVVAGLGGQGVLKASDVLSDALLRAGHDVKKSEVHGMAQRGGSVRSDVRYGPEVFSPMVSPGEADYLVALDSSQVDVCRHLLRQGGIVIAPDAIEAAALPNRRSLNVALTGALSVHLDLPAELWTAALHANFRQDLWAANEQAFRLGRLSQNGSAKHAST